jgi:hypothetical protein
MRWFRYAGLEGIRFRLKGKNLGEEALPVIYERFRWKLHWACVGLTLPQESAMVSKTRSKRIDGLTYGFLAAGALLDFASLDCIPLVEGSIPFIAVVTTTFTPVASLNCIPVDYLGNTLLHNFPGMARN